MWLYVQNQKIFKRTRDSRGSHFTIKLTLRKEEGRVFGNFCNAIHKFKVFVVGTQITLLENSRWHLIESPDNELNLIYTWCIHAINTLVFIQRCGFFNCFYTQQFLIVHKMSQVERNYLNYFSCFIQIRHNFMCCLSVLPPPKRTWSNIWVIPFSFRLYIFI